MICDMIYITTLGKSFLCLHYMTCTTVYSYLSSLSEIFFSLFFSPVTVQMQVCCDVTLKRKWTCCHMSMIRIRKSHIAAQFSKTHLPDTTPPTCLCFFALTPFTHTFVALKDQAFPWTVCLLVKRLFGRRGWGGGECKFSHRDLNRAPFMAWTGGTHISLSMLCIS